MSGLVIVRDFLDKGEYHFPVAQLPFSLYLLIHCANSCQTWYLQNTLIEENPVT